MLRTSPAHLAFHFCPQELCRLCERRPALLLSAVLQKDTEANTSMGFYLARVAYSMAEVCAVKPNLPAKPRLNASA